MKTILSIALFFGAIGSVFSQDRPNVIFVMPDDISHKSFSYYNERGPQTPHIDKLANESVQLTGFNVCPSCSPTRAALLTGRPADVVGVWHTINGRNMLRADEITMADIFQENGYATGLFLNGIWAIIILSVPKTADLKLSHGPWAAARDSNLIIGGIPIRMRTSG